MATNLKCTLCGTTDLEQGFLADSLEATAHRQANWISGIVERGLLGNVRTRGRSRLPIVAFRCNGCAHLEFFAAPNLMDSADIQDT